MPFRPISARTRLVVAAVLAAAPVPSVAQALAVDSSPAGRVEIDGVYVGTTPVVRSVGQGRRTVVVKRAGFAVWRRDVDVAASDTTRVEAALEQLLGTLTLSGLPNGATVTADGRPIEASASIGVGPSVVVVHVPGQPDARQRVSVVDGAVTRVDYRPRQFAANRLAMALAAPGSAQIVEGRPLVGLGLLVGVAGGATAAVLTDSRMREVWEEHRQSAVAYRSATSEAEVERALADMEGQADRGRRLRTVRRVAIGGAIAVYLAGATDAIVHHALRPALRASAPELPPVSLHVRDGGLSLAIPL